MFNQKKTKLEDADKALDETLDTQGETEAHHNESATNAFDNSNTTYIDWEGLISICIILIIAALIAAFTVPNEEKHQKFIASRVSRDFYWCSPELNDAECSMFRPLVLATISKHTINSKSYLFFSLSKENRNNKFVGIGAFGYVWRLVEGFLWFDLLDTFEIMADWYTDGALADGILGKTDFVADMDSIFSGIGGIRPNVNRGDERGEEEVQPSLSVNEIQDEHANSEEE